MVPSCQSGFTFLAAGRASAAAPSPTPFQKTRVRGFRRHASGRLSRRGRFRSINMPGSRACGYKSASGLGKWPNQDPLGEPGFETLRSIWPEADSTAGYVDAYLYLFVANNPLMFVDTDGRVLWPPSQWEWPHKVKNWFKNPKPPKIPGVPSNCSVGPWFGNDPYGSYGPKVYGGQISWSF